MKATMTFIAALFLAALVLPSVASAAQVGEPIELAPKAKGTRHQVWASAAWSAAAKCWLVVWREGFLNEKESEVRGARLSAAGKALDPAGKALDPAKGLQDRPWVAGDGKNFLVVWEDFRNGKDWDVYAARVSGTGKILDAGGFLVAGGAHNQCRPRVVFAKGNYLVVWQGYANGYGVYAARISPAGKVLDPQGITVAAFKQGITNQVVTPAVASNGTDVLLAMSPISKRYTQACLTVGPLDAATGKWLGTPVKPTSSRGNLRGELVRTPSPAVGENEALVLVSGVKRGPLFSLRRFDKTGKSLGEVAVGTQRVRSFLSRHALVWDGRNYLAVSGVATTSGRRGALKVRIQIRGWYISPAGKVLGEAKTGFPIAADPRKDQMLPALAAGPKGCVLAVYSEVRGVDDTKLLARLVKAE